MNAPAAVAPGAGSPARRRRATVFVLALTGVVAVSLHWIGAPLLERTAFLAGTCLALWLSDLVPPFVPSLLLLAAVPLLLGPLGASYRLAAILPWAAEPVLALFLGGFALAAAARRHGLDARVAARVVALSRGRRRALVALMAGGTAALSMWMSNIAAAAMMLAALRPLLPARHEELSFRRALLLAIAMGANLGGMATPVGSGPNAIAIAEVSSRVPLDFARWMSFAVPITLAALAAAVALLIGRYRVHGRIAVPDAATPAITPGGRGTLAVFAFTVAAWLTEPLHHVPAATIALAATAALFGTGLLGREDLGTIDWSTLILIAGGIVLGRLLERTGVVAAAASGIDWSAIPGPARLLGLVLASALLSALMSNTATATLLIPLGATVMPPPSTAIMIAIGASLGMPFVISTPPNAMVYGEGGLRATDLLALGLPLMILGCAIVALTGPAFLGTLGIP